ncbi:hypothetical protein H7X65_01495 [Candidatus Parcubacteria bacterium]|nr:hypothetical protein [Candidatus Parcubacteria bacterium]
MKIKEGHAPTLNWIKNNQNPHVSDITDLQYYITELLVAKKSARRWAVAFAIIIAILTAIVNKSAPFITILILTVLTWLIVSFGGYYQDMRKFYKTKAGAGCKIAAKYLKDWKPLSRFPDEKAMHDYLYHVASQVTVYEDKLGHGHPMTKKMRNHFHNAHRSICLFGICGASWEPYFNPPEKKKRELKGTLVEPT